MFDVSTGTRNKLNKFKSFYLRSNSKCTDGLELKYYDKSKEIKDSNFQKQYIIDELNFKNIFRLEIKTNHKKLKYTLDKLGLNDAELYMRLSDKKLLFDVYYLLLHRIIRIEHKHKVYSLLDFILE